jgi:hypothetical protein
MTNEGKDLKDMSWGEILEHNPAVLKIISSRGPCDRENLPYVQAMADAVMSLYYPKGEF